MATQEERGEERGEARKTTTQTRHNNAIADEVVRIQGLVSTRHRIAGGRVPSKEVCVTLRWRKRDDSVRGEGVENPVGREDAEAPSPAQLPSSPQPAARRSQRRPAPRGGAAPSEPAVLPADAHGAGPRWANQAPDRCLVQAEQAQQAGNTTPTTPTSRAKQELRLTRTPARSTKHSIQPTKARHSTHFASREARRAE